MLAPLKRGPNITREGYLSKSRPLPAPTARIDYFLNSPQRKKEQLIFDMPLFLLISASAVIGIVVVVPGQVRGFVSHRTDVTVPLPVVMVGAAIQQSIFAVGLAAAGTALSPRTGLEAPWFAAVSRGEGWGWAEAAAQLPAALLVGGASTVAFLFLYYKVFRPSMTSDDVIQIERMRASMGLAGRILMGGIAEEVMFRWGVMSVMAWLTISVLGMSSGVGMWTAIALAGLLFGVGHLPGVAAAGVKITKPVVFAAISLNGVVALAFGWLFWQHGLLAAIIAHALLHAVWHPLDTPQKERRRRPQSQPGLERTSVITATWTAVPGQRHPDNRVYRNQGSAQSRR